MGKRTILEYQNEVKKLTNNEFEVLGSEYINNKTKILMRHNDCGNTFEMTPHDFLAGNRCPVCRYVNIRKNQVLPLDIVKERIKTIRNDEYEILEYTSTNKLAHFKHKICNYDFWMLPNHLLRDNQCPKCMLEKRIKNQVNANNLKYDEKMINEYSNFKFMEKVTNVMKPIEILHITKNHTFKLAPYNFFKHDNNYKCPEGLKEEFVKKIKERSKNISLKNFELITPLDEIISKKYNENQSIKNIKVSVKCNKCNQISDVLFWNISDSKKETFKCSNCQIYSNEEKIKKYLTNSNIVFTQQKVFKNCKYKNVLKFDFFLKDFNLLIEYDGEFHYLPIFGIDSLNDQKIRDDIKNEYAKRNNINLLRIPFLYKDYIFEILNHLFSNYNTKKTYYSTLTNDILNIINPDLQVQLKLL